MKIFTYKNLYRAYLDCRKNKRMTANALKFEIDLEDNLKLLLEDLKSGQYQPGRSICFVVTEPCPREIFAADFRDRVVHHLFVRELIDQAEKMFIYDSYACRAGKGTHKAVSRANKFIRLSHYSRFSCSPRDCRVATHSLALSQAPRNDRWYMKLDLKSFFMSIDRNILYALTLELIDKHRRSDLWKNEISDLAGIIIFHRPQENYTRKGDPALAKLIPPHKSLLNRPENMGLPIGNYSSQFFANLYLNKLDHFIKRSLKCGHYLRYVDDLLLMSARREELKYYRDKISVYLKEKLNMELNKNKTVIQNVERGVSFLGYFLKLNKIYPKREVYRRYKNKLFKAATGVKDVRWRKSLAMAASYRGHAGYY